MAAQLGGDLDPVSRVTELLERPGEILQYNRRDILLPDIRQFWWAGGNPNVQTRDIGTSRLGQGGAAQSCLVRVATWEGALPPAARHTPLVLRLGAPAIMGGGQCLLRNFPAAPLIFGALNRVC